MSCGSLDGRGVGGRMDTGICIAESLCCPPENITALLINYTPIQNKNLNTHTEAVWIHSLELPFASCKVNMYSTLWGPRYIGEKPLWTSKEQILKILRVFTGEKLNNFWISSDIQDCLQALSKMTGLLNLEESKTGHGPGRDRFILLNTKHHLLFLVLAYTLLNFHVYKRRIIQGSEE